MRKGLVAACAVHVLGLAPAVLSVEQRANTTADPNNLFGDDGAPAASADDAATRPLAAIRGGDVASIFGDAEAGAVRSG